MSYTLDKLIEVLELLDRGNIKEACNIMLGLIAKQEQLLREHGIAVETYKRQHNLKEAENANNTGTTQG